MTKQTMVNGRVFGLSPDELSLVVEGRRLEVKDAARLPGFLRDQVERAVDSLAGLSRQGEVLRRKYCRR